MVSMTIYNNGTMAKTKSNGKLFSGGVLTVSDWCDVFWQEKDFGMCGRDSMILSRKDGKKISKNVGLFLKILIEKNKFKYSFGRKCNASSLKENPINIMLPWKNDGVDWDEIEDIVKNKSDDFFTNGFSFKNI